MDKFIAAQAITRTIALVNESGTALVASAVSYRVLNESDVVVVATAPVGSFTAGDATVGITVAAGDNALAVDAKRGLRTIELTVTTTAGNVIVTDQYMIEAQEVLEVPTNSFQTLSAAELLAAELPGLDGWVGATRSEKIAALIQARLDLALLPYSYTFTDWQSQVEPEFGVSDITLLTAAEFANLSAEFRAALVRAQLYQADEILGSNVYAGQREAGLMSQTVGESSMMFRPGKPNKQPVCDRAMRVLAKYTHRSIRIGRA